MKCDECGRYVVKVYQDRRNHKLWCVECFNATFRLIEEE